ncbi:MAG: hypothetical protein V4787_19475 [Pseudomonadota bacterium]
MNWVNETIGSFGRTIGIPGLAFDQAGALRLNLEDAGGAIELQQLKQHEPAAVVVRIAVPLNGPTRSSIRNALELADFRRTPGLQLRVAMRGREMILATQIPERSFVLSALEETIATLFRLREAILRGA